MRRSLSFLSAIAFGAAALDAQQPSSYSYDFRVSGEHDSDEMAGTVRVSGGRARVDVEDRDGDGQYLLVSGDGQVVTVVKPRERTYTIFTADDFAHIASLGLRAAGSVVTMKLHDANFETARTRRGRRHRRDARRSMCGCVESWTMEVGRDGVHDAGPADGRDGVLLRSDATPGAESADGGRGVGDDRDAVDEPGVRGALGQHAAIAGAGDAAPDGDHGAREERADVANGARGDALRCGQAWTKRSSGCRRGTRARTGILGSSR